MTTMSPTARWILALAPLVLAAVIPVVAVVVLAERLPETAVGDLSWTQFVVGTVGVPLVIAAAAALVLRSKLSPSQPLSGLTALNWAIGVILGGAQLETVARSLNPAVEPWWTARPIAAAGIAAAAMLAGWVADRGAVPVPQATSRPDPSAPRLDLTPQERATWTRSIFSRGAVIGAAFGLVLCVGALILGPGVVGTAWLLWLVVGEVALVVTAWARVRVDGERVAVVQPLLGRTLTDVDLRHVVEASARPVGDHLDDRPYGLFHDDDVFGFRARRHTDLLTLRLTDGREFAVTVDDAATAAALVNTLLDRRKEATDADPDRSDVDRPAG